MKRCCLYTLLLSLLSLSVSLSSANAQALDSLTVKVRDNADNAPIAGATVSLYAEENDSLVGTAVTGDDGNVGFGFGSISGVDDIAAHATRLGHARPNPFSSRTTLPVTTDVATALRGEVYDLLGRRIAVDERVVGAGAHAFAIDLGGLPAGAYLFRASGRNGEIGSTMLHHTGTSAESAPSIELMAGVAVVADKAAIPGTYRVEVEHPNYRPFSEGGIAIVNKVIRFAKLTFVETVPQFGVGTPGFTIIGDARSGLDVPRDLEFNPARPNELWVVNRAYDGTVTYFNPGTPQMTTLRVRDINANHFMEEVSAIAFGKDGLFATAQETTNRYDNQVDFGNNFMGPALWDSDTSIYSKSTGPGWGDLGAHIDMLHESPYGMGIAHDHDNAYWYFDGFYRNIVYYDFQQDHGPGHDDHSDGIVRRYTNAMVTRTPGVPGHMILDKESGWLYIADPGAQRITRLNTKAGVRTGIGDENTQLEELQEYSTYTAPYEILVSDGLTRPSGIVLHDGRLFVSDYATGEIIAYDLTGRELNRIDTPAQAIMGITVGPDDNLWYVDAEKNQVVRIDPQAAE